MDNKTRGLNMSKVACLTFHNSSNYGSALQAFALQQKVKMLGFDYDIIDYSNPEKLKYDSLFGKNTELSTRSYIVKVFSLVYNYVKKRKFVAFSNKYLNVLSPQFISNTDLKAISDRYDYFICGSDQIWNATMIRFDSSYFLDFVSHEDKKIAYAASFGRNSLTKVDKDFYEKNLKNFSKISVRESSAQNIVADCAGIEAELVLDPTLLMTIAEWRNVTDEISSIERPYILTYCLSPNSEMQKFISKLKKQTGLKVIGISRGLRPMYSEKATALPSPLEFVKLFLNASFVVTNSFHGTAFSTNFNRNLFSFIKGNRYDSTNSRIADFLEMVGLEKRLMTVCPEGDIEITLPDFTNTNAVLDNKRENSIKFLESSLDLI